MRGYTADRSEQFSESEALGKMLAGGTDNIQGQISEHIFKVKWLGGKRGAGVPGCGKHGVWWKIRGLSAKHSRTISLKNKV